MTSGDFRDAWDALSPRQKEWVRAKSSWERMTHWSVMENWEVPTNEQLNEDGTWK